MSFVSDHSLNRSRIEFGIGRYLKINVMIANATAILITAVRSGMYFVIAILLPP